jgi:acyl-CoA thioesterase-1
MSLELGRRFRLGRHSPQASRRRFPRPWPAHQGGSPALLGRRRHSPQVGRRRFPRPRRHSPQVATLLLALVIPAAFLGASPSPPPARPAAAQLVVFLGDSLTAGLGLPADQTYPSLLARQLRDDGLNVRVINAGVSGDTTAGGLRRLRWLLAQHPAVVVVGLGANDALRGQPVAAIEQNLRAIVTQARQAGARVLLLGMQIPPNYGPDYTSAFAAVYPRIARDLHVPLVPFLLAGVGGIADLNQADGIHPTAAGQAKVAANVKPYLEDLLRRPAAAGAHAGLGPRGPARRVTEPCSQANWRMKTQSAREIMMLASTNGRIVVGRISSSWKSSVGI